MKSASAGGARREAAALFLLAVLTAPVVVMLAAGRSGADAPQPGPPPAPEARLIPPEGHSWPPLLGQEEAAYLIGLLLDELGGSPAEGEGAVPPNCEAPEEAPVFVTLYQPPLPPARFQARERTLAGSVRAIAARARQREGARLRPEHLRVRVDVLREAWPVPVERRISFAHRGMGEPSGLALRHEETAWLLAADVAADAPGTREAMLQSVCRRAGLQPDAWRREGAQLYLLRADGFVNAAPGGRYALACPRGLPLPGEPTLARLLRAGRLAGDYLARAQTPDGTFPARWDPATGLSGGCESLSGQAGLAAALGELCELRPEPEHVTACYRALAGLIDATRTGPHGRGVAYTRRQSVCGVAFEAETSARVLEALCRYRRASGVDEPEPWIAALAEFLLFMQREDGLLDLRYDAEDDARSMPGEKAGLIEPQAQAALALALAYRELEDPRYLAGARRVLDALLAGDADRREPYEPPQARGLIEAIRHASVLQPRPDYLAWAGRIAAGRRARQLAGPRVPADLAGGAAAGFPPGAGPAGDDLAVFATACMMEAADASACRAAARRAASFVMQLQFLPENSYYLRWPQRAAGGFRERPASNVIGASTLESALRGLVALSRLELQQKATQ